MSSFMYLSRASQCLSQCAEGGRGADARLVGHQLRPVCSAQEAVEHVVEGRLERVAAGAGAGKAAGAKRRRGGAAHA